MDSHENTEPFETEESPFPLTDVDRYNLSITDAEYKPHTWEELKQIIAENKLETLRRWPSDLRRYIKWSAATKKEYGSIMAYVMQKRLKWTPSPRSTAETGPLFDYEDPTPFQDSRDFRIMPNDWPYGLDKGIVHVIVWLKNRLEVEPPRGDLTAEARTQVDAFIQEHFVQRVMDVTGGTDNVIWFKNWVSLQSVPGIDHVHVLLRDVPQDVIDESWTEGERPVQDQISL
ncbi:hypothetical protein PMZ80_000164 [Knufia obscura]|uniref:N-acetylglucosamine-induced protein 1 n=2 Tax=Knufia TaxID=430999 RepID=A0AAN8ERC5_9EURO|nr:hypothetical protein PMZ80_000164 [Knufia obscura]KAK5956907.1 hypothetical protein OHC33_002396 [Knufia fluminis]